ncbi:DNA adenine methylase [Acaryochloris sp. CCMEE 5410]|uniref:DNA adenine methylase n=1 Tax=Acaryochloris sp. CCMEE 5410 TaxID=310037 RepID=UPI00024840B0|nr:DNA adenine methylase [Acaryochloris sp. CCMEE 5410]
MGIYYSPLRYPGGKNCIFPFISNLFYENQLIGVKYAEPYSGGAGLALRLLFEGYVDHIYINDLDNSIYSFWTTLLDRSDEFCRWIEDVEVSIENWRKYRKIQDQTEVYNYFELAKSTFFLNRTNVSGVIKGGVIGGLNQTGKYKIDARFNKTDLIRRIQNIKGLKNRISVSNIDGMEFIKRLDKRKEDIFIYLDPPYYQKGANLYMNFYSYEDHKKLSKKVNALRKKWIVSYDNHEFILNLYAKNNKLRHNLSQSASNRVGNEIFIFSDKIDFTNSISALKSPEAC